eukprot:359821_1
MILGVLFAIFTAVNAQKIPSVPLRNAATADSKMPVVGLGTYGYASIPYGNDPEVWNYTVSYNSSLKWFSIGGRRWDNAYCYESKKGVADALVKLTNNYTTIPRSEIFITQKVGDCIGDALGYDNVMQQYDTLLKLFQTDYFDLVLIHWCTCTSNFSISTDPTCQIQNVSSFDAGVCRQHTWQAMMDLFHQGKARAIGTSNFEQKHLMDIFNMNSLLPAVHQLEFHGFWHEFQFIEWLQSNNITVNSYSPLGTPDVEGGQFHNWTYVLPQNPTAIAIGKNYQKTAAQVWLRWAWQKDVVVNPRSLNISHMQENIDIFDFELTANEMEQLSTVNSTAPPYPANKVCPDPSVYP